MSSPESESRNRKRESDPVSRATMPTSAWSLHADVSCKSVTASVMKVAEQESAGAQLGSTEKKRSCWTQVLNLPGENGEVGHIEYCAFLNAEDLYSGGPKNSRTELLGAETSEVLREVTSAFQTLVTGRNFRANKADSDVVEDAADTKADGEKTRRQFGANEEKDDEHEHVFQAEAVTLEKALGPLVDEKGEMQQDRPGGSNASAPEEAKPAKAQDSTAVSQAAAENEYGKLPRNIADEEPEKLSELTQPMNIEPTPMDVDATQHVPDTEVRNSNESGPAADVDPEGSVTKEVGVTEKASEDDRERDHVQPDAGGSRQEKKLAPTINSAEIQEATQGHEDFKGQAVVAGDDEVLAASMKKADLEVKKPEIEKREQITVASSFISESSIAEAPSSPDVLFSAAPPEATTPPREAPLVSNTAPSASSSRDQYNVHPDRTAKKELNYHDRTEGHRQQQQRINFTGRPSPTVNAIANKQRGHLNILQPASKLISLSSSSSNDEATATVRAAAPLQDRRQHAPPPGLVVSSFSAPRTLTRSAHSHSNSASKLQAEGQVLVAAHDPSSESQVQLDEPRPRKDDRDQAIFTVDPDDQSSAIIGVVEPMPPPLPLRRDLPRSLEPVVRPAGNSFGLWMGREEEQPSPPRGRSREVVVLPRISQQVKSSTLPARGPPDGTSMGYSDLFGSRGAPGTFQPHHLAGNGLLQNAAPNPKVVAPPSAVAASSFPGATSGGSGGGELRSMKLYPSRGLIPRPPSQPRDSTKNRSLSNGQQVVVAKNPRLANMKVVAGGSANSTND
ncbi:unnamed protein product [Amoebophrya sp. A120]|nr:unnamed protein product [Amoebophrya sp. A120]|eukprot:GSA120T00022684001.1